MDEAKVLKTFEVNSESFDVAFHKAHEKAMSWLQELEREKRPYEVKLVFESAEVDISDLYHQFDHTYSYRFRLMGRN